MGKIRKTMHANRKDYKSLKNNLVRPEGEGKKTV